MDTHPHPNDVICGRGKGSYLHIGNLIFHKLVDSNRETYLKSHKTVKTKISNSIVNAIRSQDPKGRFIEYDATSGSWVDVDNKRAVEKACQALRERKPRGKNDVRTCRRSNLSGVYNSPLTVFHSVQTETPKTDTRVNSPFSPSNLPTLVNKESDHKPRYHLTSGANLSSSCRQPNRVKNEINYKTTHNQINNEVDIDASANDTQLEICNSSLTVQTLEKIFVPQASSLVNLPVCTRYNQRADETEEEDFFTILRELKRKKIPFPKFSEASNVIPGMILSDICCSSCVASSMKEGKKSRTSSQIEPEPSLSSNITNENNALDCTHAVATNTCSRIVMPSIPRLMPSIPMLEPNKLETFTLQQSPPSNQTSQRSCENNLKTELIHSILSNPGYYTILYINKIIDNN